MAEVMKKRKIDDSASKSHSAHASSSAQGFEFSQQHQLRATLKDRRGTVGWHDLDMHSSKFKSYGPLYNLKDLFGEVKFSKEDCSTNSAAVKFPSNKRDCTHHVIAWVKYLTDKVLVPHSPRHLMYESDITVSALEEGLIPYCTSLENRPDGAILCDYEDWKLPLFFIEVHSSPYKDSVSKTAVDVLDQLRLLRCFNPKIQECVGFTFPRYNVKSLVTKVTVSFENIRFIVRLVPLKIGDVKTEVTSALDRALSIQFDSPKFCFMRFSLEDLNIASNALQGTVVQYPTRHSILLKNEKDAVFWKYLPRSHDVENIVHLKDTLAVHNPKHITLHSTSKRVGKQTFYCFPAQLPPLHKEEVGQCLCDFMTRTATALEELHLLGFSHLDVRIPNICFAKEEKEYIIKLIDLDRCSPAMDYEDLGGFEGEMYRTTDYWTTSQSDWKQLGLLAAGIIFRCSHEEIVKDRRVCEDQCLNKLIHEGEWDAVACASSANIGKYQKKTLDTVLNTRQL